MSIRKKKDGSYQVYINGKYFVGYSENSFGIYTEELARRAERDNIKYRNYFIVEEDSDIVTMKLYSKTYGYRDVLFNKCHLDKVMEYRWHLNQTRGYDYCVSTVHHPVIHSVKLHQLIINGDNDTDEIVIIDHIDNNGLNNLDINLRVADRSLINRNKSVKAENRIWRNASIQTFGNKGKPCIRINWRDINGNTYYVSLYYNDNNYDEIKHNAIIKSITERNKNGYILDKDDLEYIKTHKLKL